MKYVKIIIVPLIAVCLCLGCTPIYTLNLTRNDVGRVDGLECTGSRCDGEFDNNTLKSWKMIGDTSPRLSWKQFFSNIFAGGVNLASRAVNWNVGDTDPDTLKIENDDGLDNF